MQRGKKQNKQTIKHNHNVESYITKYCLYHLIAITLLLKHLTEEKSLGDEADDSTFC